jgi:hypothetical protein
MAIAVAQNYIGEWPGWVARDARNFVSGVERAEEIGNVGINA